MEPFEAKEVPTCHPVVAQALSLVEQQRQELLGISSLQASVICNNQRVLALKTLLKCTRMTFRQSLS